MIDHVSVAVRDLAAATKFYDAVLGALGYQRLDNRPQTVGWGKKYSDFWINLRPNMAAVPPDSGVHICLRATSKEAVECVPRCRACKWRLIRWSARPAQE